MHTIHKQHSAIYSTRKNVTVKHYSSLNIVGDKNLEKEGKMENVGSTNPTLSVLNSTSKCSFLLLL